MRASAILVFAAALTLGAGAQAESLAVYGTYGAPADIPAGIETIVVDRFEGEAGEVLGLALADALAAAEAQDRPWFRIGFASYTPGTPDNAILFGDADLSVEDTHSRIKRVTRCVKKVDKKCVEEEVVEFECRQLWVRMPSSIRLLAPDGALVYSLSEIPSRSEEYCADDASSPDVDDMADEMAKSLASRVRRDLAPTDRLENLRLMERRKGLDKASAKRFAEALKLTKTDPYAACERFAEIDGVRPGHGSVLFNRGLCSESVGDLAEAQQFYDSARQAGVDSAYLRSGLARLDARRRGFDQIERRQASLGGLTAAAVTVETASLSPQ